MNLLGLPDARAVASAPPAGRSHSSKTPTGDFFLMLAESAAALRPERPSPVKDSPREPQQADEVDPAQDAEDTPPAKPDAPPEPDRDTEPRSDDDPRETDAPTAPVVNEAASQAALAASAASAERAASAAATLAADLAETAAVETVQAAANSQAAMLAADAASQQTAGPQTALPATPAKPAVMITPADAPGEEAPAAVLLTTAPEPVTGDVVDIGTTSGAAPEAIAARLANAKPTLGKIFSVPSPPPPPPQAQPQETPAALALGQELTQQSAAPGAGVIQAVVAATVRDAAPDAPAPSVSTTGAEAPAASPPAGPGQAPAAPVAHVAPPPPAAAPAAPLLDHIGQFAVRSVRLMVHDGQETLAVRLIPESLGELHLEVSNIRDSVHVRLMSANPAVREALESQLTNLRDTLTRSGIDTASVTVSSGSTTGHASQNLFGGGHNEPGAAHPGNESGLPAGHQTTTRSTAHQGLLDLFV